MGAVAYVIRTISDQIRTTTFSSSSPIRHVMRVALGALAGLVIGLFSGLSAQLSLPPLALAFLAGYGVEAVFSTFDAIVARFREAKVESPAKLTGRPCELNTRAYSAPRQSPALSCLASSAALASADSLGSFGLAQP